MKRKMLLALSLALALIAVPAGGALAAPSGQGTTLEGVVIGVEITTDPITFAQTGVVATVEDSLGFPYVVPLTLEEAVLMGLIVPDPLDLDPTDGTTYIVNAIAVCDPLVDPLSVACTTPLVFEGVEVVTHPVALALASFFGVTPTEVMTLHEDGTGFGVIAQALFLSNNLMGDPSLFDEIVAAKKSHDFSTIPLPGGGMSDATNWGQFKKEWGQAGQNLGGVMSENLDPLSTPTTTTLTTLQTTGGGGNGHGHGKAKGHYK